MRHLGQFKKAESLASNSGNRVSFARLFQVAAMGMALFGFCLSGGADNGTTEIPVVEFEIPAFVFEPLYSSNRGIVYGVYEGRHADLVLVAGGFDSGFRAGMVCQIFQEGADVAEVIMVDVRENTSAALIRELKPENRIAPGQSVRIKTVNL